MSQETSLPEGTSVPRHIAIIPDGNRRWARARGLPTFEGHKRGFEIAPDIFRAAREMGVHTVTVWAFSTENWNRSKQEIRYLMRLYEDFIDRNLADAQQEDVRIYHLGRQDRVPVSLREKIDNAVESTAKNETHVLNIALDYGGHDELLRTLQKIIRKVKDNELKVGELAREEGRFAGKYPYYYLKNYLDTGDQPYPYPELVIRTSGEQRVSGFLSWQLAYSEFYWERSHFPDFTAEKLRRAIVDFSRRRRRFGGGDAMVPNVGFDPSKVAALEISWWQAHHRRDKAKMGQVFIRWVEELYDLDAEAAARLKQHLLKAVVCGHNRRDWVQAVSEMTNFYSLLLREKEQMDFNPRQVAELEVEWWKVHDELEGRVDKKPLEQAFQSLYGEIYQQSSFQLREAAHLRAMATYEHDLAEEEGTSEEQAREHWQKAQDYLEAFYRSLREFVS